jgi:hypothetical protein
MKRQGDLVFIKINELPKTVKKVKGNVILRGESTGHSHTLDGGDIFTKNNDLYLVILNKALINHQEHKTIRLSKGVWAVKRQREYQSKDMVRLVVD